MIDPEEVQAAPAPAPEPAESPVEEPPTPPSPGPAESPAAQPEEPPTPAPAQPEPQAAPTAANESAELSAVADGITAIANVLPHPGIVDSQANATKLHEYAKRLKEIAQTL